MASMSVVITEGVLLMIFGSYAILLQQHSMHYGLIIIAFSAVVSMKSETSDTCNGNLHLGYWQVN
jgi:hypothetical protein